MKIVTHYKLNKYNTINNRLDTSAYYSILALAREELYCTADGNSEDKDISIDNPKDKDISVNNPKDKDVSIDNPKDKNVSMDNPKDKDVSIDGPKDKDVSTDNPNVDNSIGENNLGRDSNTN